MHIGGLQKTTLLDYPGKLSACIFLQGCNFRCPFCHNSSLLSCPDTQTKTDSPFSPDEILAFLKQRRGILHGVCISGGEPTLQPDLPDFLADIQKLGYHVKLDTNGSRPQVLDSLIQRGLIQAAAMDIKQAPEHYASACGLLKTQLSIKDICSSVEILKQATHISIEFRTTVVQELHHKTDFESIASWLEGPSPYVLQVFQPSDGVLTPNLHAPSKESLVHFQDICRPRLPHTIIRGSY